MPSIVDVEGIGPKYAATLKKAGIATTDALLKRGATPAGRQEIAKASGISHELILKWVNFVDLYRIKGVGSEYSELLEKAGVDTVVELAKRMPEHLVEKMTEINKTKKLVRQMPGLKQVKNWVEQAKKLKRVIMY
jgi:predicted flap endonuclease-1-like 5' DNA nuclease